MDFTKAGKDEAKPTHVPLPLGRCEQALSAAAGAGGCCLLVPCLLLLVLALLVVLVVVLVLLVVLMVVLVLVLVLVVLVLVLVHRRLRRASLAAVYGPLARGNALLSPPLLLLLLLTPPPLLTAQSASRGRWTWAASASRRSPGARPSR